MTGAEFTPRLPLSLAPQCQSGALHHHLPPAARSYCFNPYASITHLSVVPYWGSVAYTPVSAAAKRSGSCATSMASRYGGAADSNSPCCAKCSYRLPRRRKRAVGGMLLSSATLQVLPSP